MGGTSQQRQSQGGGSSQGGDSQNGTNNTQQPQSDYDEGYALGGRYAYEIYYNRGLEPIFKNQHVLPPLEKIKVKNINESFDDIDIEGIIDGDGDIEDKVKRLVGGRFDSIDDLKNAAPLPIDPKKFMGTDHVISKEEGDKIREREKCKPVEEDIDFDKKNTQVSIDTLKRMKIDARKYMSEKDIKIIDGIETAMERFYAMDAKGIVDWRSELRQFLTSCSWTRKGPIKKGRFHLSGIAQKHLSRSQDIKRLAVYVDTSGSVNNDQTQLIPLMVRDLKNISVSCGFSEMDVMLFHHKVYEHYFDLTKTDVLKPEFHLNAKGGGTTIPSVYKDIYDLYIDPENTNKKDVDCIVIITDNDLFDGGGGKMSNPCFWSPDETYEDVLNMYLNKMLFIVYNHYASVYDGELDEILEDTISDRCKYIGIGLDDFIEQIMENADMNESKKYTRMYKLNEISFEDMEADEKETELGDNDIEKFNREMLINGRRVAIAQGDADDDIFKHITNTINDPAYGGIISGAWKEVSAEQEIEQGTYYITDNETLCFGVNINNQNIDKFMMMCDALANIGCEIECVYGNIVLKNNMRFREFCNHFPATLYGNLTLNMLPNMMSFDNAPTEGIKTADINVNNKVIDKQNNYVMILKGKGANVKCASLLMKSKNESLIEAVNERRFLAQKYINESIPVIGGMLFKPTKGRFEQNLRKENPNVTDKEFQSILGKRVATSKHNKEVFKNVLVNYGLGSLSKDDIRVVSKRDDVKDSLCGLIKNSGAEAYNRYVNIVNDIEDISSDKAFKDSYVYKAIRDAKDTGLKVTEEGLRVFLDNDDNIVAVAIVSKKKLDNGKKIKYLYYGVGEDKNLYDEFMIQDSLLKRTELYKNKVVRPFASLGFSNKNKPSSADATIRRFLYQIVFIKIAKLLGLNLQGRLTFDSYGYLDSNDIFVSRFNDDGKALLRYVVKDNYNVSGSYIGYGNYRDIDLNGRFPSLIYNNLNKSDVSHFDTYFKQNPDFGKIFTDTFLKMVVSGLGLFSEEQIEQMSSNKLQLIVNSVLDLKLDDTFFSSLRPVDKLVFEYTSLVPLMGVVKKIIEFNLPSSVMLSYNNNKIISRAGKHNDEREGVTVARRVFNEYITSNPNKARDCINVVKYSSKDYFADSGYDVNNMSNSDIVNVYFDEILPNMMYFINENILYLNTIINSNEIRDILLNVYGDESVVGDIISGMGTEIHTLKATYDIMYRSIQQISDVQFIKNGMCYNLKYLDACVTDVKNSLDSDVLSLTGTIDTNLEKRYQARKAIEALTKGLSNSAEYLYNQLTGSTGNFRDIIVNKKSDRYNKSKKVKRYSSVKMLDPVMDKINTVKPNVLNVITNVDVNNVDDPVFVTFVDYIDTYFDAMDNLVNVVASSGNNDIIRDVYDMLEDLYNGMNSLSKAKDEDRIIDICIDGDKSIYSVLRRIFMLNKNIKTGKVKLDVV